MTLFDVVREITVTYEVRTGRYRMCVLVRINRLLASVRLCRICHVGLYCEGYPYLKGGALDAPARLSRGVSMPASFAMGDKETRWVMMVEKVIFRFAGVEVVPG